MKTIPCSRTILQPTRRTALATFALAGLGASVAAAETVDRLGVPGPIVFDGTSYGLAWSSHPSPTYYKQEYLPPGQGAASYASMISLELVTGGASVASAVAAQTRMLNARKATDPLVNFSLMQNQKTGEVLLDFILSAGSPQRIVEWNAYRYGPYRGSDGEQGVVLFAVSQRAYGDDDARVFLRDLKDKRMATIGAFARLPVPAVSISR